jgi:hypothetical protein
MLSQYYQQTQRVSIAFPLKPKRTHRPRKEPQCLFARSARSITLLKAICLLIRVEAARCGLEAEAASLVRRILHKEEAEVLQ